MGEKKFDESVLEKKIDSSSESEVEVAEKPLETIKKKVIEVFEADERVNLVLGMGSSAEGKENDLSDIDVCVVMKDDAELNEILSELDVLFKEFGNYVGHYQYNPYHFYVIYEPAVPLDIYFVSSSLYFTVRSDKNKILVNHNHRQVKEDTPLVGEGWNTVKTPEKNSEKTAVLRDLFLKAWIRTFRLLSKVEKGDYTTLIYILNKIRDDQLLPLLTQVSGYNIPHVKAIGLDKFGPVERELFAKTYARPDRVSVLEAIQSMAELLKILFEKAGMQFDLSDLDNNAAHVYERIKNFS